MRRHLSLHHTAILSIFIILISISVFRAFFGIETTDEALYYSEAILINQGAVPFVDVWQQCAGSFQLYGWLISAFSIFSPNLDGLFLYMRLMYCLFRVLTTVAIYFLITARMETSQEKDMLMVTLLPVVCLWWGDWNGFSYNSLPLVFMTLSSALIISEVLKQTHERPAYWKMYAAGLLMALSAYSHASYIFCCIAVAITLYAFSPSGSRRWSYTWRYIVGGMATALVLVLSLIVKSGSMEYFLSGLRGFISNLSYLGIEKIPFLHKVKSILIFTGSVSLFLAAGIITVTAIYRLSHHNTIEGDPSIGKVLLIGSIVGLAMYVFGTGIGATITGRSASFSTASGLNAWFLITLTIIFWYLSRKRIKLNKIFLILFIPEAVLFCVHMFLIVDMPRPHLLAPACLMLTPYVCVTAKDVLQTGRGQKWLSGAVAALVCVALMITNFYVYRDSNLSQLDTRMDSTVYMGLYTTSEHAEALTTLRNYIQEYTTEDDLVFCNEFNPCVFLLSNAKYCTFSTGGGCYEYGLIDDDIMMNYMRHTGKTPTVVVYASTWVKSDLSINNPSYELNAYFNENYDRVLDTYINEAIPRVIILRRNPEKLSTEVY